MSAWSGLDQYTADDIVAAVSGALEAGDIEAVPSLMLALAWKDARRAMEVYETMHLGIAYAKAGLSD